MSDFIGSVCLCPWGLLYFLVLFSELGGGDSLGCLELRNKVGNVVKSAVKADLCYRFFREDQLPHRILYPDLGQIGRERVSADLLEGSGKMRITHFCAPGAAFCGDV